MGESGRKESDDCLGTEFIQTARVEAVASGTVHPDGFSNFSDSWAQAAFQKESCVLGKVSELSVKIKAMTEEKIEQAAEQAAEQTEAPKEETPAVNPLERSLELTVPAAEVRTLSQKYLRNYAKDARMPGFRKGHVPMAQVEQMYGMRAFDQALNELVGQAWSKAAQESGLAIACQPRIEALEGEKDS